LLPLGPETRRRPIIGERVVLEAPEHLAERARPIAVKHDLGKREVGEDVSGKGAAPLLVGQDEPPIGLRVGRQGDREVVTRSRPASVGDSPARSP